MLSPLLLAVASSYAGTALVGPKAMATNVSSWKDTAVRGHCVQSSELDRRLLCWCVWQLWGAGLVLLEQGRALVPAEVCSVCSMPVHQRITRREGLQLVCVMQQAPRFAAHFPLRPRLAEAE